ncbi:MAG: DUF126 domain-containing protein [Chloroflexota bacterium]
MNKFPLKMLLEGSSQGRPLVLDEPLSFWGGLDPHSGEVIDRRHPQSGQVVTERILLLPTGRGSSSASSILMEAVHDESAPAAIIMAEADGILALGAIVAQEVYGRSLPMGVLSSEDYTAVLGMIGADSVVDIAGGWLTIH